MAALAPAPSLPRQVPVLVLLAAAAALSVAFLAQYAGGLIPCQLCVWQRYPYGVAIGLAAIALVLIDRPTAARAVLVLAGLALLTSAGIAAFHVGVEQHWWEGLAACTGQVDLNMSAEDLKKQLLETPPVRCDAVPWSLFGVSIAGYNFLFAGPSGLATLWAALRRRQRP